MTPLASGHTPPEAPARLLLADDEENVLVGLAAVIRHDRHFGGVFYWSPEWYDGGLWDAFALFDAHGVARPGVRSLAP